jgi:hypothetical protein
MNIIAEDFMKNYIGMCLSLSFGFSTTILSSFVVIWEVFPVNLAWAFGGILTAFLFYGSLIQFLGLKICMQGCGNNAEAEDGSGSGLAPCADADPSHVLGHLNVSKWRRCRPAGYNPT